MMYTFFYWAGKYIVSLCPVFDTENVMPFLKVCFIVNLSLWIENLATKPIRDFMSIKYILILLCLFEMKLFIYTTFFLLMQSS